MIDKGKLREEAAKYGVELSGGMCDRLDLYARMLAEWNEKYNLTAITGPEEIRIKHFIDSLLVVKWIPEGESMRVIDVGSGAGFPGVVLKIARPEIRLTLLDSAGKKIRFLEALCDELGLYCEFVQERAEIAARRENYRGKFDLAVSRGVTGLPALAEYCLPFVALGGKFLAMKGPTGHAEAENAGNAASILGGKLTAAEEFLLPDGSARVILSYQKDSETPVKYPREGAQIAKKPL